MYERLTILQYLEGDYYSDEMLEEADKTGRPLQRYRILRVGITVKPAAITVSTGFQNSKDEGGRSHCVDIEADEITFTQDLIRLIEHLKNMRADVGDIKRIRQYIYNAKHYQEHLHYLNDALIFS